MLHDQQVVALPRHQTRSCPSDAPFTFPMTNNVHLNPFYAALTPEERGELDRLAAHLTPDQQRRLHEMFLSGEITITETPETRDP